MKLNKSLLVAALALGSLFAGVSATQAQDNTNTPPAAVAPPAGTRRPVMSFEAIAKQLDLSDDQKPKAEPIIKDWLQKLSDLRKDTTVAAADRREKIKSLRDDVTAKLKEVLTADQLAKWEKMGQRRPNGAGGLPPVTTPPTAAPKN